MKILYDMTTGQILEAPDLQRKQRPADFQPPHLLSEVNLQVIQSDPPEKHSLPPELANAVVIDILDKMR